MPEAPAPEPAPVAPQPEFTMPQVSVMPEAPAPEPTPVAPQPEFTMPQLSSMPEEQPAPEPAPVAPQPEFTMPKIPADLASSTPSLEQTPQSEFTMPTTSPIIEQPEVLPQTPQPEFTMPQLSPMPEAPAPEPAPQTQPAIANEPIIVADYSKQYDPVMPAAPQISKVEFKEVIDAIRECSEKIEKFGYTIDVEEYDLANLYQVVFKVEK